MSPYFKEIISSTRRGSKKKIISFSLYGDDIKYSLGAIRNVEDAKKYYPDWICRFYCSEGVENLESLSSLDCEVLVIESKIPPMYWRFFAADDKDVDFMISRDCDSLVNSREAAAVNEWAESGETLHTMHDCDMQGGHQMIVMGGMWGIRRPHGIAFGKEIDLFARKKRNYSFRYGDDQTFLREVVYKRHKNSCIDHHSKPSNSKWPNSISFPDHDPLEHGSFVGARISPFHLKKSEFIEKNKDSKKLFLMPHLGPGDHVELNGLIYHLAKQYEELVLPTKPHSNGLVDHLFGGQENIVIERIKKDAQAMGVYEDKYMNTHKFLGLGNHGEKVSNEKNLVKRCYLQAGVDFSEENNRFTVKSSTKSDFVMSDGQIDKVNKKIKTSSAQNPPLSTEGNLGIEKSPKVSVIVGTFNRWKFLNKTIESIKNQTYDNIEIIVVNDGSTDEEYSNPIPGVIWITLPQNSLDEHGFKCRSFVYNYGLHVAKGDYIAFCDDDDAWYPEKIKIQISDMTRHRSGMCATEARTGKGLFSVEKEYDLYNGKKFQRILNKKFGDRFKDGVPKFVNKELLSIHNFLIGSSVIVRKNILDQVGFLNEDKRYKKGQDYELWKRVLGVTDCIYIREPLTYYDLGHGNGREY